MRNILRKIVFIAVAYYVAKIAILGVDSIDLTCSMVVVWGSIWLIFFSRKRPKKPVRSYAPAAPRRKKRGVIGGLMNARRRMAYGMTDTIMGGLDPVLNPKGPSAADLKRMQEREKAKQDYAFHSYQAKKYAGSRDGAWHEDMANRARHKMK